MVTQVQLGDLTVDVIKKDIKNLHLSVYPPTGRVRISAPNRMDLDTIRVFAISKLSWIRQHQRDVQGQDRETPREFLDRESHYVWGRRYLLQQREAQAAPRIATPSTVMRNVLVRPLAAALVLDDEADA